MKAYRIGSALHPVFSDQGAALYPGRWNEAGQPAIYCGSSFAIAMLERLCYTALGRVPAGDRYVEAMIPDDDTMEAFDATTHPGWRDPNPTVARAFGSAWIRERRSLALLVPSAVTGIDMNLMINIAHPDAARIGVGPEMPVTWDRRLFAR